MLLGSEWQICHFYQFIYPFPHTADEFDWLIDWLIWGLTSFLTISLSYHGGQFTHSCVSRFSHSPVLHTTIFPSDWMLFHIDLAHWWKTIDACRNDFRRIWKHMAKIYGKHLFIEIMCNFSFSHNFFQNSSAWIN